MFLIVLFATLPYLMDFLTNQLLAINFELDFNQQFEYDLKLLECSLLLLQLIHTSTFFVFPFFSPLSQVKIFYTSEPHLDFSNTPMVSKLSFIKL